MELTKEYIDELIARYLAGEALPEDAMLLDEWKDSNPDNLRYFNECREALGIRLQEVDTAKLFSQVMSRVEVPEQNRQPKEIRLKPVFTPWRIAASLLLISVVALLARVAFKGTPALPDQLLASSEQTRETTLADGSHVFMNKHTKLTVVGGFNGKQRKLHLEGEAFFEVKHDEEKPFIIDAGGLEIKDIGTAFNVNANPQSDSVFVHVTEGVVELSNGSETLRLEPQESAFYIRSVNKLARYNHEAVNVDAYRTRVFSFKASTLAEVIATLNDIYGEVISLKNPKLGACRITVDFNNDSPETMAAIITETLGLSYETVEGKFIITGDSCIQ